MNFNLYDIVKFEKALGQTGGPRWVLNTDYGSSGTYIMGVVVQVTEYAITVEYPDGADLKKVNWPNYKSTDYDKNQWTYPGYLKKHSATNSADMAGDKDQDLSTSIYKKFTIKALKCCCGAKACNTTHSDWCDLYEPY